MLCCEQDRPEFKPCLNHSLAQLSSYLLSAYFIPNMESGAIETLKII